MLIAEKRNPLIDWSVRIVIIIGCFAAAVYAFTLFRPLSHFANLQLQVSKLRLASCRSMQPMSRRSPDSNLLIAFLFSIAHFC